jgi:hypothetical protein
MHRSGFFGVMVPHPGLANSLLRRGLSERFRSTLILDHEFGHFQTLPLVLLYAGAMLIGVWPNHVPSLSGLLFLLIGLQAAWEIMSECCAIAQDTEYYRRCYGGVSLWPRAIFWVLSGVLVPLSWILA